MQRLYFIVLHKFKDVRLLFPTKQIHFDSTSTNRHPDISERHWNIEMSQRVFMKYKMDSNILQYKALAIPRCWYYHLILQSTLNYLLQLDGHWHSTEMKVIYISKIFVCIILKYFNTT